jgi:hypothetical protein
MLRYAFFADFKGGNDHVLLWGDRRDMRTLADLLRQFAKSPREVRFDELGFHSVVGDVVVVVPKPTSRRARRTRETR